MVNNSESDQYTKNNMLDTNLFINSKRYTIW